MNTMRGRFQTLLAAGEAWFIDEQRALRGLSLSRILVGIASIGILITNFAHRHIVWGVSSTWLEPYREDNDFASVASLFEGSNPTVFTLKYLLLVAIAVAVLVGWRTKLTTLLLVIGMTGLVESNGLVGNQGDNILRIGLICMIFMNTSAFWSVDQRRRDQFTDPPESVVKRAVIGLPILPDWIRTPLHNAALIALGLQVFILYTASAMYKIQGEYWQEGTALYLPLSLPDYSVFPQLNELLVANSFFMVVATYFAVYIQLFFAVGLLHPFSRRVSIIGVILMHVGIAVLMGLPWFSLSMIAFDAIFISTATYMAAEKRLKDRYRQRKAAREPART